MQPFILLLVIVCRSSLAQNVLGHKTAVTSKGNITGYTLSLGSDTNQLYYGQADVFLGVPFAAPPVGKLRFQRTEDVAPWTITRNGSIWPNKCPQIDQEFLPNAEGQIKDEDCLYMNIFSPNIYSTTKYPVMIFIHGGSFATGSLEEFQDLGVIRNFVSRDVVVAIIQYRLNVLGFFTTNTTEFPANLGLLDQVQALKFVQNEIGVFGGDKNRVTIFGHSAGSCSVSAHTYSPLSRGLFQQAILESGTASLCFDGTFDYWYSSQAVALQLCNFTANQWNAGNFTALKACMQDIPFQQFLNVHGDLGDLQWTMSIDGYFMPDFPRNLAAQRPANYSNMPIMIGTARDEWGLWEIDQILGGFPLQNYNKAYSQLEMSVALRFYGEKQQLVTDIINSVYIDPPNLNDSQNTEWLKVVSRWHTDVAFEALAAREIDLWLNVNGNRNIYLYQYAHRTLISDMIRQFFNTTGWNPVFHGQELYFLFMMPSIWRANATISSNDVQIANWLGKTWTDFAKTGNLTATANWDPVRNDFSFNYLEIVPPTPVMRHDYGQVARSVFNQVIPKLTFLTPQIPPPIPTSPPPTEQTTTTSSTVISSYSLAAILTTLLAVTL